MMRFAAICSCSAAKRGDLVKVLYWDGQGLCLFAKRLERGRFIWPQATDGVVGDAAPDAQWPICRADQQRL
jgi:hypothetical protein